MPVMEAPGLTYGCGTADASRMLRKLAAPSPGKDAASAAPKRVRLISTASNSRELSRLLAAKMSCNRRHADVMNVGWPVSATDAIFAAAWDGNRWRNPCLLRESIRRHSRLDCLLPFWALERSSPRPSMPG